MPDRFNTKFKIILEKLPKGKWSLGICLSHDDLETYLYINLFIWSISIGKLAVYDDQMDNEDYFEKYVE